MDLFSEAIDALGAIDRQAGLTLDQQLKLAEIKALMAIAQQLSAIHHGGINPDYDSHTG